MLTGDGDLASLENLDDARGRAGRERGAAGLESAGVYRMKAVDVLGGIHGVEEGLGVDLFRQWKLNEDTVDVIARVEAAMSESISAVVMVSGGVMRSE